ncbi:MAG: hypothetical protein EOO27_07055 [Comamonadaceae bacterium]|nr:MAG: hypothetical protein EOO27_07055 [Comamonadaceae bacterium]
MEAKPTRGGAGRGQGRKPISPGQESVTVNVRMSTGQREKLQRLGGAPWVREKIDAEPEPPSKE